jgi:flagellar protein FliO/FliZ
VSAGASGGMAQTLLWVVLFVAAMAALPWLVRRVQQRTAGRLSAGAGVGASRVLSAVAVGPQQRVVTVEVGPEHQRTVLVLGVTAQQVNCLHVLPPRSPAPQPGAGRERAEPAFANAMAAEMSAAASTQEPRIHG